ncbi:MAG: glutathione S-transferase N-terminal domain-containing protein [Nitrospirota bacterium]
MALTLYHVHWCPECAIVREKLEELGLEYEDVVVPDVRMFRKQVHEVSGQYYVPVLKDGDLVLTETRDILSHLDARHGKGGSGTDAPPTPAARTDRKPDALSDDDRYPSCRLFPGK